MMLALQLRASAKNQRAGRRIAHYEDRSLLLGKQETERTGDVLVGSRKGMLRCKPVLEQGSAQVRRHAQAIEQRTMRITEYARPIWHTAVAEVSVDDVSALLRPIWGTKPETAGRVRGRIERVLDAAKVRGLRSGENPAAWRGNLALLMPRRRKGPKRHHPAMAYADLPGFMAKLAQRPGTSARALELLIHTAARTGEVLGATWSEFDLEAALWTVPAERMKAGKEHRVPLTEPVLALLEMLPRSSGLVFRNAEGEALSNMAMAMLLQRMELRGQITVHGFRSSFRDWVHEATDFPREIAEQALAHQVGSEVERAYRRGDALEKRRELMRRWSQWLRPRISEGE